MTDELGRAKALLIAECPAAARVILPELNSRVKVVRCGKCEHNDNGVCWQRSRTVKADGYCDEGVMRGDSQ